MAPKSKPPAESTADSSIDPRPDRALRSCEVQKLLGLSTKRGDTARRLAGEGRIREIRLNSRVLRYSERSVFAFLAGRLEGGAA